MTPNTPEIQHRTFPTSFNLERKALAPEAQPDFPAAYSEQDLGAAVDRIEIEGRRVGVNR